MGTILNEVRERHLKDYPVEEKFLKPFLSGFDVTYGTRRYTFNTYLSIYILKPEDHIKESFGITNEIMLAYSAYSKPEPRMIQAADESLFEYPLKNRADILSYFLVSDDPYIKEWLSAYYLDRQESRIIIPFSKKELLTNTGDNWFVRNRLSENFFGRDLFGYTLPLTEDTYFFGRQQVIATYIDSIKRSENRGIFGLRKTGKTSLLFKISRIVKNENIGEPFFYDCKSPSFRKLRWNAFLGEICDNISKRFKLSIIPQEGEYDEINIIKIFRKILTEVNKVHGKKIILIFDEIEYISFKSLTDEHWHKDYIDFWQTMWSAQSIHKNLVYIISGVNPSIVEIDKIDKIQNPLFGIVQYEYLRGFNIDELKTMIRAVGKRMGLNFELSAIEYLFNWYGGHPMLTRLACSWINKDLQLRKFKRPITILKNDVCDYQLNRDSDLIFYCKHVVSELQDFYPDEYAMLELLSSGQVSSFIELSAYNEFIKHLLNYGLLEYDKNRMPKISIPVLGRYIGIELAKSEGRQTIYKIVDTSNREKWLEQRKASIIRDFRMLEKLILNNILPQLFGPNSFPEADLFQNAKVVKTRHEFVVFINTCNRCFVESIENYGASIGNKKYFWVEIKTSYPSLVYSLERIKVYRHNEDHIQLNKQANQKLNDYLSEDLEDKSPSQVTDLYYILQQRVLDGILSGINSEINKLN